MQKNVAGQKIGAQMVSATDGSAFTGAVTVAVTIDAGSQATGSVGSGACTHEGNGYHTYAPAQAETNGTLIAFTFTGTGAVPVTVQVFTTGYDPTAAQIPANVTQIEGADPSDTIRDAVVDDATRIDASALNTLSGHDPGETIMGATDLGTGAGLTSLATAAELAKVPKSDSNVAWNATAAAQIQSEATDALNAYDPPTRTEATADKDEILAAIPDTTDIKGEVDQALVDIHLDHLLAATYDPASKPGAADALLNELVENDGGVSRFTANALEEAPSGGGGGGDATEAKQDQIIALIGTPANTDLAGDLADIEGKVDDLESRLGTPSNLGSGATVAANLADIEAQTDDIGVAGAGLTAVASAANLAALDGKVDTIDGIVDAILVDTAEIGAAGAGLTNINLPNQTMDIVGNITGNLSGSVGSVTGNVGGNVAGSVGSLGAQAKADVNAEADTALSDVGLTSTVTGRVDVAVSTRLAASSYTAPLDAAGTRTALGLSSANLDAQLTAIDDFLDTEIAAIKAVTDQLVAAQSEPSSVPAANATPLAKIAWLAALARNKITQTSTTQTLRNDADAADIATSTHSDDGTTHIRGEWT